MLYHYTIKVPANGENFVTTEETIVDRIDYYNDNNHYLFFDSGTETEKRFILVSNKSKTEDIAKSLKDIFETNITVEKIDAEVAEYRRES